MKAVRASKFYHKREESRLLLGEPVHKKTSAKPQVAQAIQSPANEHLLLPKFSGYFMGQFSDLYTISLN